MAQNPLPPPPPSGGVLDGWLYMLWRRLTQAGQILWESITPGTSADVAAVVTDETGSPGSLVFSGNPTLEAVTVTLNSAAVIPPTANTVIHSVGIDSANNTFQMDAYAGANSIRPVRANGTLTSPSALLANNQIFATNCVGYDGSSYSNQANWIITAAENWGGSAKGTAFALNLTPVGSTTAAQVMKVEGTGATTIGGTSTAPALKVTPVASQARWVEVTGATSSGNPQLATNAGELLLPQNIVLPKTSGKGIQVDTASPSFGWRDIIGQIGVKTAGATDPVWTLYRGAMYAYTFDTATAEAFMVFHIPHDYVPGSDLFAHVHWSQKVVDTGGTAGVPGVAEWKFDISYADGHGTAGGAADPFIAPITVTVTQQASTTQYGHMIAEVQFTNNGGTGGLIDSNTIQVDGLLLVRLYRVKANPADTLNQAPFVHTADIHYQSTNIGTKQKAPNFYT